MLSVAVCLLVFCYVVGVLLLVVMVCAVALVMWVLVLLEFFGVFE